MPEVDRGFQHNRGLQRLSILEQLKQHRTILERELLNDSDFRAVVEFASINAPAVDVSSSIAQAAKLSAAIEEKQKLIIQAKAPPSELEILKLEVEKLRAEKEIAGRPIEQSPGRFLEPQEHVPLFDRALRESKSRLLVISPWINDRVMEPKLRHLEDALRRGVKVFIGFGITERGPDDRKSRNGDQTLGWFQEKAEQYSNLHVVRLGDTHAKVLLMDDRFVVVGSFNWMSFGGFDRNENGMRVVREELSTVVTVPAMIEEMFQRYRSKFERYTKGLAPRPSREPSLFEKLVFPEPPTAPTRTQTLQPKPALKPNVPMGMTPRMIAAHLQKKPFLVINAAMKKIKFATIDTVLDDAVIKAIFADFKSPLPSQAELKILKDNVGKRT